jgi:thiamine biosynthesis lipoprotein
MFRIARRQSIVAQLQCLLLAVVLLFSTAARAAWYENSQHIMGTQITAELWHDDAEQAARLLDQVMAEMRRIEQAFSPYIDNSELSYINRQAPQGWVNASDEMLDLLAKSEQVSDLTGGAFDITYASIGRYYDYRKGQRPDDALIEENLAAIDYQHVEIDRQRRAVRFRHPAVYIDLGGIAKGHAVDRCIALLAAADVSEASVSAGGDSRILGDRRGEPWNVGIADPRADGEVTALLPLTDTAVSTSGDYERFYEDDGIRYHHILDPATGDSARASMSVTILGPEATLTDALSTSVFVMGPDKGLDLINQLDGIDAIIVAADGQMRYSADLEELRP